jgi:hypothetical protein
LGECVNGLGGSGHALALPTANSIMITCQHEWIKQCQIKYRYEPLPEGEHWEDAHYPEPECRDGTETVKLWSRDHAVHGFLQSEDLDQVCFHGFRRKTDRALIEAHYPEYLELCDRWFIEAQRRAGQKCQALHPDLAKQTFDKIRKERPEVFKEAGKQGGAKTLALGHLDSARSKRNISKLQENARRQSKKAFAALLLKNPDHQREVSLQLWEDPQHPELGRHNAGNLVKKQKSKGYPHGKENRRRVG